MNKTIIDLDNNVILRSENIEYNNGTLKNTLESVLNHNLNEREVGKLNNETLYERIIIGTIPNNDRLEIITDMSSYKFAFIDESHSFIISEKECLGINWYYSGTDFIRTLVNFKDNRVIMRLGSSSYTNLQGSQVYISLLYTKN